MNNIYICGHKKPDTDSICSAMALSSLKNSIDNENRYIPIRCGSLNSQTRHLFNTRDIKAPTFLKKINPTVEDVIRKSPEKLDCDAPVLEAMKVLDRHNMSLLPIENNDGQFEGIVTMHEVTDFLVSENLESRPSYNFFIDNFIKVVPGKFIVKGEISRFTAPIMTGALPFEVTINRINDLLQKPLLVIGLRKDLIEYAIKLNFPAIIITAADESELENIDYSNYQGTIFLSRRDTAETIRLIRLSTPISFILNSDPEKCECSDDFDSTKSRLMESRLRGYPVFNDGKYMGIVTRRSFVYKPSKKLILVDHNEQNQAIEGIDQAEIIEIYDHHRLGIIKTKKPISTTIKAVGSSCTIVFKEFINNGIKIDKENAILLLAGIVSDTVILKSPTTTEDDISAANSLAQIVGLSVDNFGQELFSYKHELGEKEIYGSILEDYKNYNENGFSIGIGQIEVLSFRSIERHKKEILEALETISKSEKSDWVMVMVSDILTQNSLLFSNSFNRGENLLIYTKIDNNIYDLPNILSRKKQLLPEILRIVEELDR